MPTSEFHGGSARHGGPAQDRAEQRLGCDELLEFLQMDPETGETSVYVFDGELARPAYGEELMWRGLDDRLSDIPAAASGGGLDMPVKATLPDTPAAAAAEFDGLDDLVERFVQRYERAYG